MELEIYNYHHCPCWSCQVFLHVYQCESVEEMWDTLKVIHEEISKVRRARINTLTHEYKLFTIKPEENIYDMQKGLIHIVNHMRTLGKVF